MKKKSFFILSFLVFSCLCIVFVITAAPGSVEKSKKTNWNVLFITIDTLRTDRLSCYSTDSVQTPNIDRFAERGTIFTRAFAHNPTTLPSHTNILLGVSPLYHGVRENANFIVRDEFLTLAEYLKNSGYTTGAIIGGYPLHSRFGLAQGFDTYEDEYPTKDFQKLSFGERKAGVVIDMGLEWLRTQDSPWFLWLHCFDPHDPYEPPEPFKTQYSKSLYEGEVAYVDHAIGELLDYMEKNSLFSTTLVIITGDHGESLGQHGETTHGFLAYNTTIWVPLIISYPANNPGRVDQNVSHIDIYPTICDILRVDKPEFLQGISLLPSMKGKRLPERIIYFESLYPYYSRGWAPLKGFVDGKEKFMESPIPELYDLKKDFEERHNLAGSVKLERYRKKLDWIIEKQSHPDSAGARQQSDRKSLERLRSLGYISSPQISSKKNYGPEDDVKTLLPYHNKAIKALELYDNGQISEGFELAKQVITERKDLDIAYSNLANMYKGQGRLKEALEVLEIGLEHLPASYGVILTYARLLVEAGRDDDVISFLENRWLPPMEHDPEIWNHLGMAYYNKEDFGKALEALEMAFSIDDEYAVVCRNLGNVYLSKYLKAKDSKDLEQSISNYNRAIELEPDYASANNSLGVAYREAGQTEKAILSWQKALALRPDVGYPLLNLGLAYLSRGEKTKALDFFNRYKKEHYRSLSQDERARLDTLIQRCERKQ